MPRGEAEALGALAARNLIAGAGNALAVIRVGQGELRQALEAAGCEVLEAPQAERGMGASLAAAVAASPAASGWIVALGDMPSIRVSTIGAVKEALENGARIAAPVHCVTFARGHPVGFAAALRDEILALQGDEGARSILARHADGLVAVPVDDAGIFVDIDKPEDLGNL